MGPLLHTEVAWLVLLSSGHFSFSIAFQGLEWLLHAFSPDLPVVVIVSRGKALLPLHSRWAELFYHGIERGLGSSAQQGAQPDRRGPHWLPHLKYSPTSASPLIDGDTEGTPAGVPFEGTAIPPVLLQQFANATTQDDWAADIRRTMWALPEAPNRPHLRN